MRHQYWNWGMLWQWCPHRKCQPFHSDTSVMVAVPLTFSHFDEIHIRNCVYMKLSRTHSTRDASNYFADVMQINSLDGKLKVAVNISTYQFQKRPNMTMRKSQQQCWRWQQLHILLSWIFIRNEPFLYNVLVSPNFTRFSIDSIILWK